MEPGAFVQPVKKENIKSIVVTSNNEFKAKAVSFFNNTAFIAEKVHFTDFDVIKSAMIGDAKFKNIVVDCTTKEGRDFLGNPEVVEVIRKSGAFILAYFATKTDPMLSLDHIKIMPNFAQYALPQAKEHYIGLFHARKPSTGIPATKSAAPSGPPKAGNVFTEATNHVKTSFEALQVMLKDRKNLPALEAVGQRFNGVFGTYSFFGDKEGFKELSQLSTVIDDICRTYATGTFKEVSEPHAALLTDAARTSFLMLKELREDKPIAAQQKADIKKITAAHLADTTILKRASKNQVDIDSMIDDLMKKAV